MGAENFAGTRVRRPRDVAVTGFNNSIEERLATPPLTTVDLPFYDQGAKVGRYAVGANKWGNGAGADHSAFQPGGAPVLRLPIAEQCARQPIPARVGLIRSGAANS